MSPEQATIKRATKAAQQSVERLDADALSELEHIYRQAAAEISTAIGRYAGADGNLMLTELQSVLAQVNGQIRKITYQRDALLGEALSHAVSLGTEPLAAVLETSAMMRVNDTALAFVRNFVAADGLQLSDRIWRLDRQARDLVTNAIEMAVIQGHGAAQAAREFLARGQPVPIDLQDKISAASAGKISRETTDALLTGSGSPMDNAMRLMRTEINRAHGTAYMMGAAEHPDVVGFRYLLSPAHPEPDICDLLSTQNLYGLGDGVYPKDKIDSVWPAHPNTLSFVVAVFKDEVTDADRAGKETPMQALERLTQAQRVGVLGVNKAKAYDAGQIRQGMIRAPWRAVQQRIGSIKPDIKPKIKPAAIGLDDMIASGRGISADLLNKYGSDGALLLEKLHEQLRAARPIMTEAKIQNGGKGAELVRAASKMFPDDWTKAADRHGPLYAKFSRARGGYVDVALARAGTGYRIFGHSGTARGGEGFIRAGNFSTALHEYVHRLQHTIPALDDFFQTLHERRTDGDYLERLRDLYPRHGYGRNEVTRKDEYRNAYQGKIYSGQTYLGKHGALEVMTMAFQDVLGGSAQDLASLVEKDREMFDLVIGLLFKYVP